MAVRSSIDNKDRSRGKTAQDTAADDAQIRAAARTSTALFVIGIAALLVAVVSGLMLVLESLGGISLPGCGEGSACAEATASVWGKVPRVDWPVSFLGFAYFLGAFIAWLGSRHGITPLFRNVVRLGAMISLGFVLVIFIEGHHCSYCLISHAGNFAFWIVTEISRKASVPSLRPASLRPVATLALVFLVCSAVLGITKWRTEAIAEADQQQRLEESIAEIVAADNQRKTATATETAGGESPPPQQGTKAPDAPEAVDTARTTKPPATTETAAVAGTTETHGVAETAQASGATGSLPASASAPANTAEAAEAVRERDLPPWGEGGFRGRYLWGPEKAPVRLVMLTDYQCRDCNRIEDEVREMLRQRNDVSLSIKLFPMCTDCNWTMHKNMHPNACWAARAAEAAGILGGNDGFWDMHFWLFDHDGGFTGAELDEGLAEFGFDRTEFIRLMTGEETLDRVKSDIQEGLWLGLHFTPMVFINGVELKGVFARNAVPRAVAAVAANHPPPMTHEHDQPPPATEKYIADWRDGHARRLPSDQHPWANGPLDAKVKIVMWADYHESYSADADRTIREWMAGRQDVRYTFRHFPFDQACNPVVSRTAHPQACRASLAAEAAGELGGVDAYWKMHVWLMDHQEDFSEETLRQAATEMGLDADALFAAMDGPEAAAAIEEDTRAAKPDQKSGGSLLYRGGIPTIYVNGKVIPRWRLEGKPILRMILDEAYKE
ncbi:MAG: thioredoxin domain-containing protein [Phycisphaerae bacterium]|nr:thioredoxin domain-containing protein [Phycisphaerae bacterium]